MRKPVLGVSDLVRHKPSFAATEDGYRLEIADLGSRRIVLSRIYPCSENKGADQVTAKLICVFVFAHAKKPVFS